MNIIKLAEVLGIDTTCEKQELDKLRIEYGVGIDTARAMIVEPKIYEQIKELVKSIQENNLKRNLKDTGRIIEILTKENEQLKAEIAELEEKFLTLNGKSYSYYTILQEIKAIAEEDCEFCDDIGGCMDNECRRVRILDLITKSEEE